MPPPRRSRAATAPRATIPTSPITRSWCGRRGRSSAGSATAWVRWPPPRRTHAVALLAKSQDKLCVTCHEDIRKKITGPAPHTAAARGLCTACHEPHGSKQDKLLRAKGGALCEKCHAGVGKEGDHVHSPVADGEWT